MSWRSPRSPSPGCWSFPGGQARSWPWQSHLLQGPYSHTAGTPPAPLGERGLRRQSRMKGVRERPREPQEMDGKEPLGIPGLFSGKGVDHRRVYKRCWERKPGGSEGGSLRYPPCFTQFSHTEIPLLLDHLIIYSPESHHIVVTHHSPHIRKKWREEVRILKCISFLSHVPSCLWNQT